MRETVTITSATIKPAPSAVLKLQGVPADQTPDERTTSILEQARELLMQLATPKGVFATISKIDFASVYEGRGENELDTPLTGIFTQADGLALFAVTVGEAVSERIKTLFDANDFALGAMLDSCASVAADQTAAFLQQQVHKKLMAHENIPEITRALRYSPGYCGWHVSGQPALFAILRPQDIGISLRKSCLMEPLKSVSGVIVCGPPAIHKFDDTYDFCADCATRDCRNRQ